MQGGQKLPIIAREMVVHSGQQMQSKKQCCGEQAKLSKPQTNTLLLYFLLLSITLYFLLSPKI